MTGPGGFAHHRFSSEFLSFLRAALPLVMTNCVNAAQSMLTIFLASTISLSAAAAAGYINRVYFVYGAVIISLNGAGSIRLNRLNGPGQGGEFDRVLKNMVRFSILGALICFFIFFLGANYIAERSNPGGTVDSVPQYLRWMSIAYMAVTLASPYYMALIARRSGRYIFRSVVLSLSIGSAFSVVSVILFKSDLSCLGAGCALAEVIYLVLITRAYKRLSLSATPDMMPDLPGPLVRFENSFAKDAGNLFWALIASTLIDFLILYILVDDVQFVALMSFYFSTTAMFQGVVLGFATAASVSIAEAIGKGQAVYMATVARYLLYILPLALVCAMLCCGYLWYVLLQSESQVGDVLSYVVVIISLATFFSCLGLFAQRAVLRAKGDTTFMKKLAFIVSVLIKFPLVFYISQCQPISGVRTGLLFSVFLLCSLVGLVAIGLRILRSFRVEKPVSTIMPVSKAGS